MTAQILHMPRAQFQEKTAGLVASTLETEGALTVEACAMYEQILNLARHADRLMHEAAEAEQSHRRAALARRLDFIRSQIGMLVDEVYRVACEAPDSRFAQCREAQMRLVAECVARLVPAKALA